MSSDPTLQNPLQVNIYSSTKINQSQIKPKATSEMSSIPIKLTTIAFTEKVKLNLRGGGSDDGSDDDSDDGYEADSEKDDSEPDDWSPPQSEGGFSDDAPGYYAGSDADHPNNSSESDDSW